VAFLWKYLVKLNFFFRIDYVSEVEFKRIAGLLNCEIEGISLEIGSMDEWKNDEMITNNCVSSIFEKIRIMKNLKKMEIILIEYNLFCYIRKFVCFCLLGCQWLEIRLESLFVNHLKRLKC
jgi:hypothetical protein